MFSDCRLDINGVKNEEEEKKNPPKKTGDAAKKKKKKKKKVGQAPRPRHISASQGCPFYGNHFSRAPVSGDSASESCNP